MGVGSGLPPPRAGVLPPITPWSCAWSRGLAGRLREGRLLPGGAEQREEVAVDAEVAGALFQARIRSIAAKKRTGLVETVPASRKLMFIRYFEEGRDADQRADEQAEPDRDLAEDDQPGEPGVPAALGQEPG